MIIGLFSFSRSLFSPEKMPGVYDALATYFRDAPWWRIWSPLPSLRNLLRLSKQQTYPSLAQIVRCFDLHNLDRDSEDWGLFCGVVEALPLQQYLNLEELLALVRALSVYEIADNGELQECMCAYFLRELPRPLSLQQLIKLHQMTEGKMSFSQLLRVINYCDISKFMSLVRSCANTAYYDLDVFIDMTRMCDVQFVDGLFDRSDYLCSLFAILPEAYKNYKISPLIYFDILPKDPGESIRLYTKLFTLFPNQLSKDQLVDLFRIGHNRRAELITMVELLCDNGVDVDDALFDKLLAIFGRFSKMQYLSKLTGALTQLFKQEHLDNDLVKKQLVNIIGFGDKLQHFIVIIDCLFKNGARVDDATFEAIINSRDLQYLRNAVVSFEENEPLLFPAYIHIVVQHAYAAAMAEAITELRNGGYLFTRNIEILKKQINPRKAADLILSFRKNKLSNDVVDEVFNHDTNCGLADALLILIQGGLWPDDKTKQQQQLDFLKNHDSQQPAAIASIMVYNYVKEQRRLEPQDVLTLLRGIELLVDWDAVKSIYEFCQFPLSLTITPEVVEMIIDNKDLIYLLPQVMVLYALSLVNCLCPSLESDTIIDPSIAFPKATQVLKRVAESYCNAFKAVGKAAAHFAAEIYILAPDEVKKDCWPGQWNKDCDRPLTRFFAVPSGDKCSANAVADTVYAQAATKRAAH